VANPSGPIEVAAITAVELRRRLDAGEPLALLDVREPAERAFCTIAAPAGVRDLHIPMREVPARLDEIRQTAAGVQVVVYCHLGVRSAHVTGWLLSQSVASAVNLVGGIDAWSRDVDPAVPRY
jgi:rhodanese-related sulfurtransferase